MLTDKQLLNWTNVDIKYYSKMSRQDYLKLKLNRLQKLISGFRDTDTLLMSYEETKALTAEMAYQQKAVAATMAELNDLKE